MNTERSRQDWPCAIDTDMGLTVPNGIKGWHSLTAAIASWLQQGRELQQILQDTTEGIRSLLGCEQVVLYHSAETCLLGTTTAPLRADPASSLSAPDPGGDWWMDHQPSGFIAIEDASSNSLRGDLRQFLAVFAARGLLFIPVFMEHHYWGVLVASESAPRLWQTDEISALQGLVLQLGIAIGHSAGGLDAARAGLLEAQSRVLELLARDASLEEILTCLVQVLEGQFADMLASVRFLQDGELYRGVGPNMPLAYSRATERIRVAEGVASSGTAAWRREPVLVSNIGTDPLWDHYRETALRAGIWACWAVPIIDAAGEVLGTLSMHHRQPREATDRDLQLLEVAANLAGLAIARKRTEEALRRSEAHNRALIQAIPDLFIRLDTEGRHLDFLSGGGLRLLNAEASRKPNATVYDVLPAELADLRMTYVRRALSTGEVQFYEHRIVVEGEAHYEETRVIPYRENEVLLVVRDISDLKHSQQALQQANEQLRARLDDLNQRNAEMRLLSEMGDFLQACVSVEEAFTALSSLLKPLFPRCFGVVYAIDASRSRVEPVARWGASERERLPFRPGECWALRRGRVHLVTGDQSGLRCQHALTDEAASITLCIPMIAQGEALGLFYLSAEHADALPLNARQLAHTVAEQVALAIANLQLRQTLFQQSIRDPLTGLYNRRYLEESLVRETSRARRHGQPIGVIMLDVDHFKGFNDTHGHDAGDRVLRAVARLLRENVRASDLVCRYGGEEMTLVLPGTTLEETLGRAEVIREGIAELAVSHEGRSLSGITASLGVACFPQHGDSGDAVMQAADAALYLAKNAGRDQVIAAP